MVAARQGAEARARRAAAALDRQRVLKWVGIAALGWILLSFLAFAVSAQLQSFKLSGEAQGRPARQPLAAAQRPDDPRPRHRRAPARHQGARRRPSQKCFEQQAHGDAPHDGCEAGQFRADTLMLIRAGGGAFRKLSIPRDSYAEIPGQSPQKINAAYAFGGAKAQIEAVEGFLDIQIDHVAIVDFTGFEDLIDAVGGVEGRRPRTSSAPTSPAAPAAARAASRCACTRARTRSTAKRRSPTRACASRANAPARARAPTRSATTTSTAAQAQQRVINGIKERLTDPLRLPYNFIHGPIIGWDAPKAFVSDMGFLTMPQLILSAAIGGSGKTDVLCAGAHSGCDPEGPEGSVEVPESTRRRAVDRLLNG